MPALLSTKWNYWVLVFTLASYECPWLAQGIVPLLATPDAERPRSPAAASPPGNGGIGGGLIGQGV